jgi:hypothetical protein
MSDRGEVVHWAQPIPHGLKIGCADASIAHIAGEGHRRASGLPARRCECQAARARRGLRLGGKCPSPPPNSQFQSRLKCKPNMATGSVMCPPPPAATDRILLPRINTIGSNPPLCFRLFYQSCARARSAFSGRFRNRARRHGERARPFRRRLLQAFLFSLGVTTLAVVAIAKDGRRFFSS